MTGALLSAFMASRLVRRLAPYALAGITIALLLLNLRRAGERTGRIAERLETMERTNVLQRHMLEAAADRPRDRNDLARRLRDGRF